MQARPQPTLKSQRGVGLWLFTLGLISNPIFIVIALIEGFRHERLNGLIVEIVVSIVWGLGLLYLALSFFTTVFELNQEKLVTKSLFGIRTVSFKDVVDIELIPFYGDTIFFGYNVVIHFEKEKGLGVMSSVYGNRHQLLKAIIERAHYESPGFVLSPTLKKVYGPPPYGITQ